MNGNFNIGSGLNGLQMELLGKFVDSLDINKYITLIPETTYWVAALD